MRGEKGVRDADGLVRDTGSEPTETVAAREAVFVNMQVLPYPT